MTFTEIRTGFINGTLSCKATEAALVAIGKRKDVAWNYIVTWSAVGNAAARKSN